MGNTGSMSPKIEITNDWMGIIGEIRLAATQHVNRVVPLALTCKRGSKHRLTEEGFAISLITDDGKPRWLG